MMVFRFVAAVRAAMAVETLLAFGLLARRFRQFEEVNVKDNPRNEPLLSLGWATGGLAAISELG